MNYPYCLNYQTRGYKFRPMSGWNGSIGSQRLDPFMNTPSKSSEAAWPGPARAAARNTRTATSASRSRLSQALKRDDELGHGRSQLVMA